MSACLSASGSRRLSRYIWGAALLTVLVVPPVPPASGQEPGTAPTPAPSEQTPGPAPARPVSPPFLDPTGPVPPAPVVPSEVPPATIFVPPPTVPSRATPTILLPGGPGAPASPTFDFGFSLTAAEEYSDNFNLDPDRSKQENFRSSLSPGVTLDVNTAFIKGHVGYTLSPTHDTSTGDISLFHSLLAGVAWEATPRLRFTLSDAFTHSDEPTQADRLSLRRVRRPFTSNSVATSASYLIDRVATTVYYDWSIFSTESTSTIPSERTSSHTLGLSAATTFYAANTITGGYEYLTSDSEGAVVGGVATGDTSLSGHRVHASFQRQLSTLTSAGIAGSYAIRHDEGLATGRQGDFNLWDVSVFGSYAGPNLSLSGSLGYGQSTQESGGTDSVITTATSLTYRFARAVATLSVDSGFSETFAEGQNSGLVQTSGVTGSLTYPFTASIAGTVSGFYRDNRPIGGTGDRDDQRESTWGATVGIDVRLTRWLGLSLYYAHTESNSSGQGPRQDDLFGQDYTENRARIALRASF